MFLNQVPDPSNPEKPYYSVRAPQSQTIPFHGQNIPWYFQNWDGDGVDFQNFTQTATAALFKGHLVSANSAATGANNGRRMALDAEGTLHSITATHPIF